MATDYTIPKDEYRALLDENARLRDLMYDRAHVYAIQHMTEDELRIAATNVMEENRKLRELCADMFRDFANCDYELKRHGRTFMAVTRYLDRIRELGVEVSK